MACSNPIHQLINKVIDQDATEQERHEVEEHIKTCEHCQMHYEELCETDRLLGNMTKAAVPDYFTEKVLQRLARDGERQPKVLFWLKRHPFATAAALFIVLMAGYVFSLWEQVPFQAKVQGSGKVAYEDHQTVVVPKGEVIKGDLIVQNGKVKIEGKVDGDVILINSETLLASAGHVTGDIKEINQVLDWVWYHIKQFVGQLFFALPSIKGSGQHPSLFHCLGNDYLIRCAYKAVDPSY